MRIQLDKIASSTANCRLRPQAILTDQIPAQAGTVLAVRVRDDKDRYNQLEDVHGRMMPVHAGDTLAVVLGERRALRGYTGEVPARVEVGDTLHLLNLGGLVGRCTSASPEVGPAARVEVLGAILDFPELGSRQGQAASIQPGPVPLAHQLDPLPPAVFVVGTCMHAGKTAAACALVRQASARGLRVAVAKVTGVSLRRDVLEMQDHGAIAALTFNDAGLASTTGTDAVVAAAKGCLNRLATLEPDLLVVELGDGLLGEYGVDELLSDPQLQRAASAVVLSAADPVAAWGGVRLLQSMGTPADVITGPATDNEAGSSAIARQLGLAAHNARTSPRAFADAVLAKALPARAQPPRLQVAK